ncbi:hypothetical protein GQ42DRAFT_162745 [Ramicandelaber brevisporus]|nr:hypothetical protein GQ42DRAFT_162745 [Ramicandelaber brevisporus]
MTPTNPVSAISSALTPVTLSASAIQRRVSHAHLQPTRSIQSRTQTDGSTPNTAIRHHGEETSAGGELYFRAKRLKSAMGVAKGIIAYQSQLLSHRSITNQRRAFDATWVHNASGRYNDLFRCYTQQSEDFLKYKIEKRFETKKHNDAVLKYTALHNENEKRKRDNIYEAEQLKRKHNEKLAELEKKIDHLQIDNDTLRSQIQQQQQQQQLTDANALSSATSTTAVSAPAMQLPPDEKLVKHLTDSSNTIRQQSTTIQQLQFNLDLAERSLTDVRQSERSLKETVAAKDDQIQQLSNTNSTLQQKVADLKSHQLSELIANGFIKDDGDTGDAIARLLKVITSQRDQIAKLETLIGNQVSSDSAVTSSEAIEALQSLES